MHSTLVKTVGDGQWNARYQLDIGGNDFGFWGIGIGAVAAQSFLKDPSQRPSRQEMDP